jgi:hypothetical protein
LRLASHEQWEANGLGEHNDYVMITAIDEATSERIQDCLLTH